MCFELLPNEILIQCLEYLNGPDIFYSFDQLNYRFYKLIRSMPLYLNFQHITKTIFDQFCRKMFLNPAIKNQVLSLELSNKSDTCHQITAFLSKFSLEEFNHLRSLTLIKMNNKNLEQLSSILPFLSNLTYLSCDLFNISNNYNLFFIPWSTIRTLSVSKLLYRSIPMHKTTSVTNLTVSYCHLGQVYQLLQHASNLKYLKMLDIKGENYGNFVVTQAIHLKTLIIETSYMKFNSFEELLSQTPNVNTLILSTNENDVDIIDAYRWEHLISVSLPHLKIFKFHFRVWIVNKNEIIWTPDDILQNFQTYFWQEQHHWYTECQIDDRSAVIYTTPYMSDYCTLTPDMIRYYDISMSNSKVFDKVTNLTVDSLAMTNNSDHYFANVQSLRLKTEVAFNNTSNYFLLKREDIQSLKKIVNLFYIKHLSIAKSCRMKSSSTLLQILKEASQLSSLMISKNILIPMLNNRNLCKYLNKMIKKLDIQTYVSANIHPKEMDKFCKVFSNLEQLKCNIYQWDDLPFILRRLSRYTKLSSLDVSCSYAFTGNINNWLQDIAYKLRRNFRFTFIPYNDSEDAELCMWIGEEMRTHSSKHGRLPFP